VSGWNVTVELTAGLGDTEVHGPPQPFSLLMAAKAWAAQTVAEWFRDHDDDERAAALELVQLVEDLEGDGPTFVRSDPRLGVRVTVWTAPPRLRAVPDPCPQCGGTDLLLDPDQGGVCSDCVADR
jgi:hypothetical protein